MRAPPCNNETETPCLVCLEGSNLLVPPRRSCSERRSLFPASVYHDVTCIRARVSPRRRSRGYPSFPSCKRAPTSSSACWKGAPAQTRVSRAPSVFFPSVNHPMLPAACHTRFYPHLAKCPPLSSPTATSQPSFFHPPLKALIYAPIIAHSVNCLKNLSNTKSCMEPLSVSQRLCLGSNSASK